MKTKRNLINASFPMVGTTCPPSLEALARPRRNAVKAGWSSADVLQRAVPTFQRRNLIQIWLLCAAMLQVLNAFAQPVTQIAAGYAHSLFLKSDGSLWGMGYNNYGQLGDGTTNNINHPEQIVASNVTAIAAGAYHTLFLKSDGSLWAVGRNTSGQLGDGSNINTNLPEQIVASNVTAIAAGALHSLFLMNNGSLWAMGYNSSGQLGDGTYIQTARPELIVPTNVTTIAAGVIHSLFLKSDGSLWTMGDNYYGELGDGTYTTRNRPEQIVASGVTAIAARGNYSLFLKSNHSLWGMGLNQNGQLGDGTYGTAYPYATNRPEQIVASNITTIAAGLGPHSLFLKGDGSLWAMGWNKWGQLGDGTTNNINRPEQITSGFLPGYNQICCQLLGGAKMQLSFVGNAGWNYALERASRLSPADWIPQATNPAGSFGALVFTNPPDATTNNFWRIRSVP